MSWTITITAAVAPTVISLSIIRGKTAIYYIDFLNADGTPFPLTGAVLYFYASNGSFAINKSSLIGGSPAINQGIVITDVANGLATLTILPADTMTLGAQGTYGMPCELTMTGGSPAGTLDMATGNLTISPNVGIP